MTLYSLEIIGYSYNNTQLWTVFSQSAGREEVEAWLRKNGFKQMESDQGLLPGTVTERWSNNEPALITFQHLPGQLGPVTLGKARFVWAILIPHMTLDQISIQKPEVHAD